MTTTDSVPSISTAPLRRFAAFVAVIVATLGLVACDDKPSPSAAVIRPAMTVVVSANEPQIRRSYPAIVLPTQQAELSFRVSGRVVELPVRAPNEVKKGDVIAQLDRRDFQTALGQLESQLEQAKAKLSEMLSGARSEDRTASQANVRAARAQVEAQSKQVERIRRLVEQGTVARAQLDEEHAKLAAERARLTATQQEQVKGEVGARKEEVAAQQATIRGLENQVQQARDNLTDTTLRAPFDGVVASREIDNFANVQANSTVVVLQKLAVIDLRFDVPGPDVSLLSKYEDKTIIARLDGEPDKQYEAKLVEASTQADPATQTFRVRVSIENPQDSLVLSGMTGSVVVIANTGDEREIMVPASALVAAADGSAFVWVVNTPGNTVGQRKVTSKHILGDRVGISDGLADGDVVVTAGLSYLRENMAVRPIAATNK